ncbi:MAG: sugar phosphate isomerase/epimerase [Phycisphaerae bacterium]|nr:sugar phosphate isomerase/epimerase [Phycisphaerae bacterium]
MLGPYPLGACLPTFTSCADRYCLSGYGGGGKTMEEILDLAVQVKPLDGVELVGNWHVNDENIDEVAGMLRERKLKLCLLTPDLWTQAKWGKGSLAAGDKATRAAAVEEVKKVMDWAERLDCAYVNVWPGQDGYDYCFQADFPAAMKWLREGVARCAAHNPKVKVLVEYKLKEPRTHCYVNSASKVLLLLEGIENTGCLLDVGHALAAGENMAEAACLLAEYGKLDYIHLNDNYRSWDDDMLVSAVHVPEYLEFVYWLKRLDYQGWLTLDIFPYREEKIASAAESFAWLELLFAAVEKVGMKEIESVIRRGEGTEASRILRKMLS